MARLPALIDALALIDDRGRSTVDLVGRTIREAGLIEAGKRGRGGAEMTPEAAAALIMGLCGAEAPAAAPEAVRAFGNLFGSMDFEAQIAARAPVPDQLATVAEATNFADALAELIRSARKISELALEAAKVRAAARAKSGTRLLPGTDGWQGGFTFRVTFHRPTPWAEIEIAWDTAEGPRGFYRRFGFKRGTGTDDSAPGHLGPWERTVAVTLGFMPFVRLHELLMA